MAARKKRRASKRKGETPKILSTSKVLRVIEKLGADPKQFLKLYAEDHSRGPKAGPPTREQIAAVTAFQKDGDTAALMKSTGLKTPGAALNLVGRVSRHAAKGNR